ncbi:MAG: hypothetical protein DMD93_21380 [Candidatus Rokuibacteriota bacterium]|nr:MAG: hypothetical protein DMD93_21380 [Candidatus Rokubacteria bacterium]
MRILTSLLIVVTFVCVLDSAATTNAGAAKPAKLSAQLVVPLTGTVAGGGAFSGTFSIARFEVQQGKINAVGMIAGVVTGLAGPVGSVVLGPTALPVTAISGEALPSGSGIITQQQAGCEVLHLQIGGLTLDLLGLQVALSPVTLDIVGGSGPLGSLICEIVALLENVVAVVGLLNQLLGLVGGLIGA